MPSWPARRPGMVMLALAAVAGLWMSVVRFGPHARRVRAARGGAGAVLNVGEPQRFPVETWTARFQEREAAGDWAGLVEDLEAVREGDPDLFRRYRLAYLEARARLSAGRPAEARAALEPFLAAGDPFRDLALHWAAQAEAAQGHAEEASRLRQQLAFDYPEAPWRARAIEDEAEALSASGDPARIAAFLDRLGTTVEAPVRRDLESRVVAARAAKGDAGAVEPGLALLRANAGDDAAERVAAALDRPEWVDHRTPEDWALLGETFRNARHFDRAVELLERARKQLPGKRDDLLFAIGRAWFGQEKYPEAERVYLEGAPGAKDGETRASFLYQAARCAQLLGDDARAEKHLAAAIPAGKGTTRGSAALTQRLRIRVRQRRFPEAFADLRAVQKDYAKSHAVVEATLAFAVGSIAADRDAAAAAELERLKPRLLTKGDVPEVQYWRARAVERKDPRLAARIYLKVLKADVPTHFAHFARERLAAAPLAARVGAEIQARQAEVDRRVAAEDYEGARDLQTEIALLAPPDREAAALDRLRDLYGHVPGFQAVRDLPPPQYPRFPLFGEGAEPARLDLLLAAGLFDDAVDLVTKRWPLHPLPEAVARSEALRRGGASRASIYAIEVSKEDLPAGYLPDLLPRLVRELIYPRYFWADIAEESRRQGADPRLVVSIMREESRFNPRAKSAAAARGLLQFIITTAREVGRAIGLVDVGAQDLYDPHVVIRLGARYIGDLLRQFEGNGYRTAAAYNAGPNQAKLWARLAPGPGDDVFLSSINFDETKDYVRKVMNSYERYGEVYENRPPAGGVQPQP